MTLKSSFTLTLFCVFYQLFLICFVTFVTTKCKQFLLFPRMKRFDSNLQFSPFNFTLEKNSKPVAYIKYTKRQKKKTIAKLVCFVSHFLKYKHSAFWIFFTCNLYEHLSTFTIYSPANWGNYQITLQHSSIYPNGLSLHIIFLPER
jgi:hypothetical protein